MPREILLPALEADFESGEIVEWHKQVGDRVEVGDVLVDISTEKAIVELESEVAGTLGRILVEAGTADVAVNTPIALVLLEGEDDSALEGWSPSAGAQDEAAEASTGPVELSGHEETMAEQTDGPVRGRRLYASPIARRLAERAGIDLGRIQGSGPRGRVVLGDVEAEAARLGINLLAPSTGPGESAEEAGAASRVEPADHIRKVIAERLTAAKRDIPHFYLTVDFRIDRLLDARRQLNEFAAEGARVSVNDFFVKACALALREVPAVNASWTGDGIAYFDEVNISIAVASPRGLMTPVLRAADRKSLAVISGEIRDLAARAHQGRLKPAEFRGGGFTISNLGMYGVREFAAIINPPQACILAIGAGEQRPVARDGAVVIETMATCTLSVDHRAVDGALGAEFLQVLRHFVEHPVHLVA